MHGRKHCIHKEQTHNIRSKIWKPQKKEINKWGYSVETHVVNSYSQKRIYFALPLQILTRLYTNDQTKHPVGKLCTKKQLPNILMHKKKSISYLKQEMYNAQFKSKYQGNNTILATSMIIIFGKSTIMLKISLPYWPLAC